MKFSRCFIVAIAFLGFFNYAHAAKVGFGSEAVSINENVGAHPVQIRLDEPIILEDPQYPHPDLVISLISDNPSRVTVSPSTITYNANEWFQYKTFTVTPVDNGLTDGDIVVHVNASVVSGSEYYDGFTTSLPVTVFDDEDVTGPLLTEITKIKKHTTIDDAVYQYSMNGEVHYHCQLGFENSTDTHAVVHADGRELTFQGLIVGGKYRGTLVCDDHNHNQSNMLDTGTFTIVDNYRNVIGSLPPKQEVATVSLPVISIVPPAVFLRFGQTSPEVKILQQLLNKQGVLVSSSGDGSVGLETEYFGLKTLQAVKTFQKLHGLDVDGVVGAKTWELLK